MDKKILCTLTYPPSPTNTLLWEASTQHLLEIRQTSQVILGYLQSKQTCFVVATPHGMEL